MSTLKILAAGVAVGMIAVAFRDFENDRWLEPAIPDGLGTLGGGRAQALEEDEEEEPVLGYDGMDQETLIDWLGSAELDEDTLRRMRRYEARGRQRGPVLAAIGDLLP